MGEVGYLYRYKAEGCHATCRLSESIMGGMLPCVAHPTSYSNSKPRRRHFLAQNQSSHYPRVSIEFTCIQWIPHYPALQSTGLIKIDIDILTWVHLVMMLH